MLWRKESDAAEISKASSLGDQNVVFNLFFAGTLSFVCQVSLCAHRYSSRKPPRSKVKRGGYGNRFSLRCRPQKRGTKIAWFFFLWQTTATLFFQRSLNSFFRCGHSAFISGVRFFIFKCTMWVIKDKVLYTIGGGLRRGFALLEGIPGGLINSLLCVWKIILVFIISERQRDHSLHKEKFSIYARPYLIG